MHSHSSIILYDDHVIFSYEDVCNSYVNLLDFFLILCKLMNVQICTFLVGSLHKLGL